MLTPNFYYFFQVEVIKAERAAIESELKSATIDMKSTFLSALAQDGAINEAAISMESLGRAFSPLQQQVKDSLQRQERLVAEIQVWHMPVNLILQLS